MIPQFNYRFIDPETGKLNRAVYMQWVWKWHKAGKKWETAHARVMDDVLDERSKARQAKVKPVENSKYGMHNMDREIAKYWNYGS